MRPINCPSALNVVAGQTLIQDLPVGSLVYEGLQMELTNITFAQLTNIRLLADGREVFFCESGEVLQKINNYYSRPAVANTLHIMFSRPELVVLNDQRQFGFPTANLQSLVLQADVDAAAVNPAFKCHRFVTAHNAENSMPIISKLKRFPHAPSAAGDYELDKLTLGGRILAMHFYKGDVNSVSFQDESHVVYEGTKTGLESWQQMYGRTPQTADMTTVDFILDNDSGKALVTTMVGSDGIERTKALRVIADIGAAGSMPVYVEYMDVIGNL